MHELVATRDELVPAAKKWILEHRDDAEAAQSPWDRPGYKMPGGTPKSPALAAFLPAFPALLRQQTKGASYPAQRAILSAAVEGAMVDIDTALRIESRYLTSLMVGQNAKNMIQAFFFDLQAINAGKLRPEGFETFRATKVAVLGAGMMGAGIAYSCARVGHGGRAQGRLARGGRARQGLLREAARQGHLARQVDRGEEGRAAGPDHPDRRRRRPRGLRPGHRGGLRGPEPQAPGLRRGGAVRRTADALLCSNTSTLPITELATGVDRPADFIGLHFFSPVDKMPLVEIIKGKETSDEALAKAYDVVQQIRKTPIVVNDSRGFYTSRVIGFMVNEGLAMLAEGVHPVSLERAATQSGYPVGPLQLSDELNMELMLKIGKATADAAERDGLRLRRAPRHRRGEADGRARPPVAAQGRRLLRVRRGRRAHPRLAGPGRGVPASPTTPVPFQDVKDRMLFAEALETAKCFEEGVLTSAAAANIGSIMGIGFPPNTGGAAQFMTGYESASGEIGLKAFVARADELAAAYGDRFRPTVPARAGGEGRVLPGLAVPSRQWPTWSRSRSSSRTTSGRPCASATSS